MAFLIFAGLAPVASAIFPVVINSAALIESPCESDGNITQCSPNLQRSTCQTVQNRRQPRASVVQQSGDHFPRAFAPSAAKAHSHRVFAHGKARVHPPAHPLFGSECCRCEASATRRIVQLCKGSRNEADVVLSAEQKRRKTLCDLRKGSFFKREIWRPPTLPDP